MLTVLKIMNENSVDLTCNHVIKDKVNIVSDTKPLIVSQLKNNYKNTNKAMQLLAQITH